MSLAFSKGNADVYPCPKRPWDDVIQPSSKSWDFMKLSLSFSFQKLRSKCDALLDDNGLFLLLAGRVHRRAMKRHANDLTAQSNGVLHFLFFGSGL